MSFRGHVVLIWQSSPAVFVKVQIIWARRSNVELDTRDQFSAYRTQETALNRTSYINLSAFSIKVGLMNH